MSRWIRLNIDWSCRDWLSVLSAESRLVWIELLCHVKAYGSCGRTRALAPERFARQIYIGEESVRQLLKAAELAGALEIDGQDWVITNWAKYQSDDTAAERMRRYRERKKEGNVTDVTRNHRSVTDVTTTKTSIINKNNKKIPESVEHVEAYAEQRGLPKTEAQAFWDYFSSNGWRVGKAKNPMADWQAAFRTWEKNWRERNIAAPQKSRPPKMTPEQIKERFSN